MRVALSAARVALLLSGCGEKPVEKAKARHAFLKENNATKGEVCNAAKAVQDAATEEGNSAAHKEAEVGVIIDCMNLDPEGRDMPYNIEGSFSDEAIDAANGH
jgi:hypothetical protein